MMLCQLRHVMPCILFYSAIRRYEVLSSYSLLLLSFCLDFIAYTPSFVVLCAWRLLCT